MTTIRSLYRLARDLSVNLQITPGRRQRWARSLTDRIVMPDTCQTGHSPTNPETVEIGKWFRWGLGGSGTHATLRGSETVPSGQTAFWLKWCPKLTAAEFDVSYRRMQCWRSLHPELADQVPPTIAYLADEQLILMEARPGRPLSTAWWEVADRSHLKDQLETTVMKIGAWLRDFGRGRDTYGSEITPLLGDHGRIDTAGHLRVDARHQIECRILQAEQAADQLARDGLSVASQWADRFDLDAIVASFHNDEPGGFMHGDMKPDNVLIDGDDFTVIDWWMTPSVSWPLPDAAIFATALTTQAPGPLGHALLTCFLDAYLQNGNEHNLQAMDLIGTIWLLCMTAVASRRGIVARMLTRKESEQLVRRAVSQSVLAANQKAA